MLNYFMVPHSFKNILREHCKTCVKRPLSKIPKIGFQDLVSLNTG